MKDVFKKSLGMLLVDAAFIGLTYIPRVRKEGWALVMFALCLGVMTILTVHDNIIEMRTGEPAGETKFTKMSYYAGTAFAAAGVILLILQKWVFV